MARRPLRSTSSKRRQSHSIIYVIKSEILEAHKIGVTNDWHRRKRELEVGNTTRAVHVARIDNARSLERYLHDKFKKSRLPQSEWFRLEEQDLDIVRKAIRKAKDDYEQAKADAQTVSVAARQATPLFSHSSVETKAIQNKVSLHGLPTIKNPREDGRAQVEGHRNPHRECPAEAKDPAKEQRTSRLETHKAVALAGCVAWLIGVNFKAMVEDNTPAIEAVGLLIATFPLIYIFSAGVSIPIGAFTARIHNRISPIKHQ